jgi:hypothetical protein
MEDPELHAAPTYRNLNETVWRVRFGGLRLTEGDLALMLGATALTVFALKIAGVAETWFLTPELTLDPWLWIFVMVGLGYAISLGHLYAPDYQLEDVLRGVGLPRLHSPLLADRRWRRRP